ncbi:hypothetical protein AB6A40_003707 [Gnathostoma spinigerum]|uniref:Uncharacterized protein n=1 Tax=Gnathostoma spinigerum TaxID=75299 RepID=A0ABD6EAH4_9BILA
MVEGPAFLQQDQNSWPRDDDTSRISTLIVKAKAIIPVDIIDYKRFNQLVTLQATIVRLFQAVKRMTRNITIQLNHRRWEDIKLEGPITAQKLQVAEVILVIQEQTKASEEIDEMRDSFNV